MKRGRKVIQSNAIIVFDSDVLSSELKSFPKDFKGDIFIIGSLIYDESIVIECDNLFVMNEISDYECESIIINGNVYSKDIDCFSINVNGSVYSSGNLNCVEINVAEDLHVKGNVNAHKNDINIGGEFICEGSVIADDVFVLKRINTGPIKANSICVG